MHGYRLGIVGHPTKITFIYYIMQILKSNLFDLFFVKNVCFWYHTVIFSARLKISERCRYVEYGYMNVYLLRTYMYNCTIKIWKHSTYECMYSTLYIVHTRVYIVFIYYVYVVPLSTNKFLMIQY